MNRRHNVWWIGFLELKPLPSGPYAAYGGAFTTAVTLARNSRDAEAVIHRIIIKMGLEVTDSEPLQPFRTLSRVDLKKKFFKRLRQRPRRIGRVNTTAIFTYPPETI